MIASIAKGFATKGKSHAGRSMSTIRYAEYGHPLNVLKYVSLLVVAKKNSKLSRSRERERERWGICALCCSYTTQRCAVRCVLGDRNGSV